MLGLDLGRELGTLRLALGEGWAPMNDGLHAWMNDRAKEQLDYISFALHSESVAHNIH